MSNAVLTRLSLLDLEQFESALIRIFARFSSSYQTRHPTSSKQTASLPRPDAADVLTEAELDAFSTVTNGSALPLESKDEIKEFLDTDKDGNLTFAGFCEMYHLQSDNEPEETWKDLAKLGFDDNLEYIGESLKEAGSEEATPSEASEAKKDGEDKDNA